MGRWIALSVSLGLLACSHPKPIPEPAVANPDAHATLTFVDPALGFEISRPQGDAWKFAPGEGGTAEQNVAVPVIIAHRVSGAQVVVQVAPARATAEELARRLTEGLKQRPGFTTTEVEPVSLTNGTVGFAFTMGDHVAGRVTVVSSPSGKIYVLLATWPQDVAPAVLTGVDEIVRSLKMEPVEG